jgi:hypothetical protein
MIFANSTAFAVNELYISWRPALPMLYPDRKNLEFQAGIFGLRSLSLSLAKLPGDA